MGVGGLAQRRENVGGLLMDVKRYVLRLRAKGLRANEIGALAWWRLSAVPNAGLSVGKEALGVDYALCTGSNVGAAGAGFLVPRRSKKSSAQTKREHLWQNS